MRLRHVFEGLNGVGDTDGRDDFLQKNLGTYVALEVSQETKDAIQRFAEDFAIVNFVDPDTLHCTVIYSPKFLPEFHALGVLEESHYGYNPQFEVWDTQSGKRALVIRFQSDSIVKRHESIMEEHEAEYAFKEYKPHVTISYDIGDKDYDLAQMTYELSRYLEYLRFDYEYEEPLNIEKDEDK